MRVEDLYSQYDQRYLHRSSPGDLFGENLWGPLGNGLGIALLRGLWFYRRLCRTSFRPLRESVLAPIFHAI